MGTSQSFMRKLTVIQCHPLALPLSTSSTVQQTIERTPAGRQKLSNSYRMMIQQFAMESRYAIELNGPHIPVRNLLVIT